MPLFQATCLKHPSDGDSIRPSSTNLSVEELEYAPRNELRISDDWRAIAPIVDRYEEQIGPELPDLLPFLEGVPAESRIKILAALLQVEQEVRWKRNQGKTVEEYLEQFPELRTMATWCGSSRALVPLALPCRGRDIPPGVYRPLSRLRPGVQHGERRHDVVRSSVSRDRVQEMPAGPAGSPRPLSSGVADRERHHSAWCIAAAIPELDRLVAIKIGRSASRSADAFLHEAKSVARLHHPNLVTLLDYGTAEDGNPYIVYEYIAGCTLADRIAARDYTLGDTLRWMIALAKRTCTSHIGSAFIIATSSPVTS